MSHTDQLKLLSNCKPFNATSPQWLPLALRMKASALCEWVNSWIYQDTDRPAVVCVFVLLAAGERRDRCLANMSWDKCITNGWWDERQRKRDGEKLNCLLCFLYCTLGYNESFTLRSDECKCPFTQLGHTRTMLHHKRLASLYPPLEKHCR